MNNDINKPHTAVISVQLEVHSLLDTGECSGQVISAEVLNKHEIAPNFLLTVSGFTLDDCLQKLKTKIEMLHGRE